MSDDGSKSPDFWIQILAGEDGAGRKSAREQLVALGREATPALLELLEDPRSSIRWEAALALKEIEDPAAASALALAMKDENADVRWVAGEALAAIGVEGLRHLLQVLKEDADSFEVRDAAHVAMGLLRERGRQAQLSGVYKALKKGYAPEVVTVEAAQALETLLREGQSRG